MTKKQRMYADIQKHGENLNAIFNTGIEPVTLCKKLRTLEKKAHRIATDYCNGENGINSETIDSLTAPILAKVARILGESNPIRFNGDARGYALKLSDSYVRGLRDSGKNIYTDMGGYGIIAPEFTGE